MKSSFVAAVLAISALTLAAWRSGTPVVTQTAWTRPNVLIVVLDDVSPAMIGAYGEPNAPCTPNIDALADEGMRFTRCWAMPLCSPARAALLTGRYGFRNGIGQNIESDMAMRGLAGSEKTLAERLDAAYSTALVGKWHLSNDSQPDGPRKVGGFDWAAGSMFNLNYGLPFGGYTRWTLTSNGIATETTEYATQYTAGLALNRMRSMSSPWLLYLSLNAPHIPAHVPPDPYSYCSQTVTKAGKIRASLEAADWWLGAVIDEARLQGAYIFVIGDNGAVADVGGCKGEVYDCGAHVPLIVAGPGVQQGTSDALVSIVDLYATIGELARLSTPTATDSVSFVNVLQGRGTGARRFLYTEKFGSNFIPSGPFAPQWHERSVRSADWTLVRRSGTHASDDELYYLAIDPQQMVNRLPLDANDPNDAAALDAYESLQGELERLGVP